MNDLKAVLSKRFEKPSDKATKMDKLAAQTASGALSSFSGVFKVHDLSEKERKSLEDLLTQYRSEQQEISQDLDALSMITSEVKAINNQAIILHGERIKKAQQLLKKYKDGAFSNWLIATYGNRQTPYNFLQYYEFYTSLSQAIQRYIDLMPKQVIYTLASRQGSLKEKEQFILSYQGETKNELLALLRASFPLEEKDLRKQNLPAQALQQLNKLIELFCNKAFKPSHEEREDIMVLIEQLRQLALKKEKNH